MLAQGDGKGRVDLLPAIPEVWRKGGEFKVLRVRGGYTVSCRWKDGEIVSFSVTPVSGMKPANVFAFGRKVSVVSCKQ
jgi:alpha-L-fucosidase 2